MNFSSMDTFRQYVELRYLLAYCHHHKQIPVGFTEEEILTRRVAFAEAPPLYVYRYKLIKAVRVSMRTLGYLPPNLRMLIEDDLGWLGSYFYLEGSSFDLFQEQYRLRYYTAVSEAYLPPGLCLKKAIDHQDGELLLKLLCSDRLENVKLELLVRYMVSPCCGPEEGPAQVSQEGLQCLLSLLQEAHRLSEVSMELSLAYEKLDNQSQRQMVVNFLCLSWAMERLTPRPLLEAGISLADKKGLRFLKLYLQGLQSYQQTLALVVESRPVRRTRGLRTKDSGDVAQCEIKDSVRIGQCEIKDSVGIAHLDCTGCLPADSA